MASVDNHPFGNLPGKTFKTQSPLGPPMARPILTTVWFGSFVTVDDRVVDHVLFPKDPEGIAKRLSELEGGWVLDEEKDLWKRHQGLVGSEERMRKLGAGEYADPVRLDPKDYGYDRSLQREALIKLGEMKLRAPPSPDQHIIQAVSAMEDLDRVINLHYERLREWYDLHWPELKLELRPTAYIKAIADHGDRENLAKETGLDWTDSLGAELRDQDQKSIITLAGSAREAVKARESMEKYVESEMRDVAPNLHTLTGGVLGAKLMASAGGLDRLARMPSSTIQVLGAERALFRHIKTGSRPPKHGILFQHPMVNSSPYWQRGKIARTLAGKVAIAAKADRFGDSMIGDVLKEQTEKRVQAIHKQFPKPPTRRFKKSHGRKKGNNRGGYKGGLNEVSNRRGKGGSRGGDGRRGGKRRR